MIDFIAIRCIADQKQYTLYTRGFIIFRIHSRTTYQVRLILMFCRPDQGGAGPGRQDPGTRPGTLSAEESAHHGPRIQLRYLSRGRAREYNLGYNMKFKK